MVINKTEELKFATPEAIPIVQSSLNLEKGILELSLNEYSKQLNEFEDKYGFSTSEFVKKFDSGKLGDEANWFDWFFAYKVQKHLKKKMEIIKNVNLVKY